MAKKKKLSKKFTEDFKKLNDLITSDLNIKRGLESIFKSIRRIDPKSRHHFYESNVIGLLGNRPARALRVILFRNDREFLESVEKQLSPSEETMRFLDGVLTEYGHEFEDLYERGHFENNWSSLRSNALYNIDSGRLESRVEIMTVSNKVLILDGTFESIFRFICALTASITEDLENAKKTVPDLKVRPTPKRFEDLRRNLNKMKELCAHTEIPS